MRERILYDDRQLITYVFEFTRVALYDAVYARYRHH